MAQQMFSHVFVSVGDFERSLNFFRPLMDSLGIELRFQDSEKPWAGWHSAGQTRPLFVICKPFDGQPHTPGNGQLIAFQAASRQMVRVAHQSALDHGGSCEGKPGLRLQYHPNYYGAYFRDPDGNKFCVTCHMPDLEKA